MSPAEREFDIVLYGATGFSGKLTAEHLAHSGSTARIALAGRSSERLRGVRMMLGPNAADWPLILADASQPLTLEAMAARAQVVLTTVGPYTRYGLPLVAACAKAGTDYADLTGELMFCRNSIDLYHKQAADTGARIILACGFDSIPSDLNVYQLYRRSVEDGTGELCDTDLVLRSFSQRWVSGGSVATYSEAMRTASSDPEARRLVTDPYTLTTDRGAEPELGAQPDFLRRPGRDLAPELAGFWTGGFVQAPFNTRIVRRSNALQEWAYGRRFRYSETMSLGKSMAAPILAAAVTGTVAGTIGLGNKYFDRLPRRLVERVTPKPGTGPSRKTQERGPLHLRDVHHHDDRCPLQGDFRAQRRRVQVDRGVARAEWSGAGARSRSARRAAGGAHSRSGDGRCVVGAPPGRRRGHGNDQAELTSPPRPPARLAMPWAH